MRYYRQVPEDAEYREYYDSYRVTVENLNSTDFLYKSMLSNGQVFFDADEVYGMVNNQAAIRGRNLTIAKEYIDNFVIRDFQVFTRSTNTLLNININCNLKDYRDGKPHYLYIVLSNKGKYEVHDDMFQSDETKLLFARFIIDRQGNSRQFYMMLPFAGSADYIKGNQFYQVTDGLRVEVLNNNTKQLTLTDAKVRFSGINFEDVSSPDCLEINFEGNAVPIRYCTWDNTDHVPRVDWNMEPLTSLNLTRVMNYETGATSAVAEGKYSIQKLYYDIYEKCIVALYGDAVYDSRIEAIYGIDSVMRYVLPDGIEYLIPIAAIIAENTEEPISDDNFRIVNLDYNEKEVLDSDTFTRQQSAESMFKSREAIQRVNELDAALSNHAGDRTNPHQVRLNQLYNSNNEPVVLADDYADWSVSSILSRAAVDAADIYYRKDGGIISGNVIIGSENAAKNLTTFGNADIKGNTSLGGTLSLGGNITTNGTYNVGTTSARLGIIYTTSLNASSDSTVSGTLTSRSIIPETTTSYNLGSDQKRFNGLYVKNIGASGNLTVSGTASIGGKLTGANASFSGAVDFSNRANVPNGYLVIGGYSLRLGGSGGIPTQNGYGIW